MLLSEAYTLANEESNVPHALYNLIVDDDIEKLIVHVPANLREVSIISKFDHKTKRLTDECLDIAIALNQNYTNVIFEVEGCEYDVNLLLSDASNSNFSISFLKNGTDIQSYTEQQLKVLDIYFSMKNFQSMLWPISGYIGYLFEDTIGFQHDQITTDPYMRVNFLDGWSDEELDYLKSRLKTSIYEYFGGLDGIKAYISSAGSAILSRMKDFAE